MHAVGESPATTPATGVAARRRRAVAGRRAYLGDGRDVLLQGFHWDSHAGVPDPAGGRKSWYRIVADNAPAVRAAGFTWVWLPPPSDSLAPQGYLPRRWDRLDSAYGTAADLRAAIAALGPDSHIEKPDHAAGGRPGGGP